jgi:CRISPR-associated protein Cmr2
MSKSLLIFSIGPVQPFIAQARRAGDLASGSWLLSRLMRAALAAAGREGGDVLYPVLPSQAEGASLPNKLVALIRDSLGETIAVACEKAVQDVWLNAAKAAGERLTGLIAGDKTWQQMWHSQTVRFPEIYWCITPWPASDVEVQRLLGSGKAATYGDIFSIADRALEARKALRSFTAVEEPGDKCSVCGQRSALHRTGERPHGYWKAVASTNRVTGAQLRPGGRERLCAFCAVKRFGDLGEDKFPSLSLVAVADFKARLLRRMQGNELGSDLMARLMAHQTVLRALNLHTIPENTIPFLAAEAEKVSPVWQQLAHGLLCYDGDVLFPETFTEDRLQDSYGLEVAPEQAADARRKTVDLLDAALNADMAGPRRAYAILLLDGDRVGRSLSKVKSPDEHRAISAALARFAAEEGRRIVEVERPGRIIYAGGDDVLALLPVEHAMTAAAELSHVFGTVLKDTLRAPSVSASVVFAHHLYPLEAVLRAARQAERVAKDGYSRNAIVVHLLKRAGGDVIAGAGWADEGAVDIVEWVVDVARRFADGRLSPKLAHVVCAEADTLIGLPRDAQRAELKRLALRQAGEDPPREEKQQQAEELAHAIAALAASAESRQREADEAHDPVPGIEVAARWLLVSAFLAQIGGGGE